MKVARAIAWAGLCAWVLLLTCLAWGMATDEPLAMKIAEPIAVGSVFATMFNAARRAFRVGQPRWGLGAIFIWPLAFYYVLALRHAAHEA